MARPDKPFMIQLTYINKEDCFMKYVSPHAVMLLLSTEDVITASFTQTTITNGDYSVNKDVIDFDDLTS